MSLILEALLRFSIAFFLLYDNTEDVSHSHFTVWSVFVTLNTKLPLCCVNLLSGTIYHKLVGW